SLLGPRYDNAAIKAMLDRTGCIYHHLEDEAIDECVSNLLASAKVISRFQGRMEFGPRALGNRSIIGDARSESMQSVMNLKIKFRESFRPFAPGVRRERAADYFELDGESPYMLLVAPIKSELRRPVSPGAK